MLFHDAFVDGMVSWTPAQARARLADVQQTFPDAIIVETPETLLLSIPMHFKNELGTLFEYLPWDITAEGRIRMDKLVRIVQAAQHFKGPALSLKLSSNGFAVPDRLPANEARTQTFLLNYGLHVHVGASVYDVPLQPYAKKAFVAALGHTLQTLQASFGAGTLKFVLQDTPEQFVFHSAAAPPKVSFENLSRVTRAEFTPDAAAPPAASASAAAKAPMQSALISVRFLDSEIHIVVPVHGDQVQMRDLHRELVQTGMVITKSCALKVGPRAYSLDDAISFPLASLLDPPVTLLCEMDKRGVPPPPPAGPLPGSFNRPLYGPRKAIDGTVTISVLKFDSETAKPIHIRVNAIARAGRKLDVRDVFQQVERTPGAGAVRNGAYLVQQRKRYGALAGGELDAAQAISVPVPLFNYPRP